MILDTAGAPMPPPKDLYSDKRVIVPMQSVRFLQLVL